MSSTGRILIAVLPKTNAWTVKIYSLRFWGGFMGKACFWSRFSVSPQPCGSAGQVLGHVFPSGDGEHAWRENRPSEEHVWTGQVITSTRPLWDNVLPNVIKAFIGVWEVSSLYQKLSSASWFLDTGQE